jgi:hypothetical protein
MLRACLDIKNTHNPKKEKKKGKRNKIPPKRTEARNNINKSVPFATHRLQEGFSTAAPLEI